MTTFLPSVFFSTGKTPEELEDLRPKLRPKLIEEEVLDLLGNGTLSLSEISHQLGHKRVSGGLKKVIQGLIDQRIISYTVPDKPRSKLQKYKLSE